MEAPSAFGMEVVAWSENRTEAAASIAGVRRVDKNRRLLAETDWVTLHLVPPERTRGILGAADLARMKPSAWLVDTARGPLVDEAALVDALRRRAIAGAALDVEPLTPGPPAPHPAQQVAMPHMGFVTQDTFRVFSGETVENLLAWMAGARSGRCEPCGTPARRPLLVDPKDFWPLSEP